MGTYQVGWVTVEVPDGSVPVGGAEAGEDSDWLLEGLQDDDEVTGIEAVSLAFAQEGGLESGEARVAILRTEPLDPDEYAMAVTRVDGVYEWQLPSEEASPGVESGSDGLAFAIPIPPQAAVEGGRGPVAFVIRFVVGRLESKIREGLVVIQSPDFEDWIPIEEASVELPPEAEILLLVHGTFSSTVGGFCGLGALDRRGNPLNAAGRDFLEKAIARYGAVLGFDHRTLSQTPEQNADAFASALGDLVGDGAATVDAVTHSRGALVLRSMAARSLPKTVEYRTAILVAGVNDGTALADPDNWSTFANVYTNLLVGALGLLSFAPGLRTALMGLVKGVLKSLAWLAKKAVTEVPGLGVQEPGSDFLNRLRASETGDLPQYHAITSDFEPSTPGQLSGVSPSLASKVVDWAIDELMDEANDLVVDTESMSKVPVGDSYDFGRGTAEREVPHHCNFFHFTRTATEARNRLGLPAS